MANHVTAALDAMRDHAAPDGSLEPTVAAGVANRLLLAERRMAALEAVAETVARLLGKYSIDTPDGWRTRYESAIDDWRALRDFAALETPAAVGAKETTT